MLKVGDWVCVKYTYWQGEVLEVRGPLAPGGVQVYRIKIDKDFSAEFREDQLVSTTKPSGM